MQTEDNQALWDAIIEQNDNLQSLEYFVKELREQIANLRQ